MSVFSIFGNGKATAAGDAAALGPPTRGRMEIEGLTKAFGGHRANGIEDISLHCREGEFVCVVGPSGCGKSTLLNCIAGMVQADHGTIRLDGKEVSQPGPDRAVVFQDHGLFPWLSAAQNIAFGLKMAGMSRSERSDRVQTALKMVHLTASADKLVHELSGGMKQRVAIARALVIDPAVLLMDEPFASLDAQTRTLLHAQLQEIWTETKKTILFVTHSVGEAVRLADRIVVLHAHPGRIRRVVDINLTHPRDFDGTDITELVHLVRKEIEDEVNRANSQIAEFWKPASAAGVDRDSFSLGDGI